MSCCFCFGADTIHERQVAIIENCGKASRTAPAGCVCLVPCFEVVRARMSLKIHQISITCETKTKDNVFVSITISVLYRVMPDKVMDAFYKLTDPIAQIKSYVLDVVRSTMPKMTLDESFASKDVVANDVKKTLSDKLSEVGYEIVGSLVTDIEPDARVKFAMNDINASMRQREARSFIADAEKILQVKAAEAEAESKYLSGLGVAKQRKAIVDGLRGVVNDFNTNIKGTTSQDVMDLLLLTQYFDVMKEISKKTTTSSGSTIFLPHGPGAIAQMREELKRQTKAGK